MAVAVLAAASLSHDWSSWNGFWHRQAILPRSFFTDRGLGALAVLDRGCTLLNRILVRGGWIVAVVALVGLQSVYLALLVRKRDHCWRLRFVRGISLVKLVAAEGVILLGATLYFAALTAAFTRLSALVGTCETADGAVHFPVLPESCAVGKGAAFKGFDISGHCFLIVHSCLLVLEYGVKAWYVWWCPVDGAAGDVMLKEKDSDLEDQLERVDGLDSFGNYEPKNKESGPKQMSLSLLPNPQSSNHASPALFFILLAISLVIAVIVLAEIGIFLQTLLFYHTVTEKLLGTMIGSAYWGVLFALSFWYPHLF